MNNITHSLDVLISIYSFEIGIRTRERGNNNEEEMKSTNMEIDMVGIRGPIPENIPLRSPTKNTAVVNNKMVGEIFGSIPTMRRK